MHATYMRTEMQAAVEKRNSRGGAIGSIRPLVRDDLGSLVELYQKVFPQGRQYSRDRLYARFDKVLLRNPWCDPSIPSLVYELKGRLVGFLGTVVRPMWLGAEPLRAAVCNHFMVDPDARFTRAGFELLSKHFAGVQDLSIAEAGDSSRKIWEALGGGISFSRSLHWTRLLRPAHYSLHQLETKAFASPLSWVVRPFCSAIDACAARIRQSPLFQFPQPAEEELSEQDLLACIARFTKPSSLRPHYDERSLHWLLSLVAEKRLLGTLRKSLVRGDGGEIVGWYIYYLNPGKVSTVVQICASPGRIHEVLTRLSYHAWRGGSIALSGRLDPRFAKTFCDDQCLLHCRSWMLVHARNPKILKCLDYGKDTFFTSLEGEFWISVEEELWDNLPAEKVKRAQPTH